MVNSGFIDCLVKIRNRSLTFIDGDGVSSVCAGGDGNRRNTECKGAPAKNPNTKEPNAETIGSNARIIERIWYSYSFVVSSPVMRCLLVVEYAVSFAITSKEADPKI